MRILVITTSFPELKDGSEAAGAFVADFVRELAAHAAVCVLAPGTRSGMYQDGHVTVHRFHVPRLPLSLLKPSNPLDWFAIAQTLASGQKALDDLTAAQPFDHILALWALPSGYWARNARRQIPYSTWALGSDIWTLGRIPVVRGTLRKVLQDAKLRFADGIALARDVSAICGRTCQFLSSSRQLGCKATTPELAIAPYKLVFLGRFHPNKGIDLLLESLKSLSIDDWRAIDGIRIAGGGPLQAEVECEVRKLKVKGLPVSLEGYKNCAEARELLEWGDIVLIPSRIESIPVIFSDAMQAGKPVIATPVGDLPTLIREYQVGSVADRIDSESYKRLLTPDALEHAAHLAPNTRQAAKKFSVVVSAQNFMTSISSSLA